VSKELAKIKHVIPTQLGNVIVTRTIVYEYDVEDICRYNAESVGRSLQMTYAGETVKSMEWTKDLIPSTYLTE
jgi:hypothetical protein